MQIFLARNNKQAGPYTLDELNTMMADGQVELSDLAWHEGLDNWQMLSELTGGASVYNGIPQNNTSMAAVPSSSVSETATYQTKSVNTQKKNANQAVPATKGQRVSAIMLDFALFIACLIPLTKYAPAISKIQHKYTEQLADSNVSFASVANKISMEMAQQIPATTISFVSLAVLAYIVLQFIILLLRSQTIGKAVVGIRVVNIDTLKTPSASDLIIKRMLLMMPLFLFLGFWAVVIYSILVFLNKDGQLPHEKFSHTKLYAANEEQLKK